MSFGRTLEETRGNRGHRAPHHPVLDTKKTTCVHLPVCFSFRGKKKKKRKVWRVSSGGVTYLLTDYMSRHAALSQVSFSHQTQYFIGRNLQSISYPVEMMKWSWSTMKVTFGRWTAFIFITAEFLYYFPLIKHETPSLLRFSACDKCFSFST